MHLVGFTIEIYYDARSYRRKIIHFICYIYHGSSPRWFEFQGNPNNSTHLIVRMAEKLLYILSLPLQFSRLQFYLFILFFLNFFCYLVLH